MKTAVLLSGGVDSSVVLRLLQSAGVKNLEAFYLKIWLEDELSYLGSCPWEEDLSYASAVCEQAGIELHIKNLQVDYFDKVVWYAISELREGRTPSPDIFCNQQIKFGAFAASLPETYQYIASGHYAIVNRGPVINFPWEKPWRMPRYDPWELLNNKDESPKVRLYRAPDPIKDQTYFLSQLAPEQLSRLSCPLGNKEKQAVRELATTYNLPNMNRPDSQGICFLGKIPYRDFVKHYLGENKGPLVDVNSGKIVGEHKGFWFHTIGQRSGLGLAGGPWYVSAKDVAENIVYVSHAEDNPSVSQAVFTVENMHWLAGVVPSKERLDWWNSLDGLLDGSNQQNYAGLQVKLRHGPRLTCCKITQLDFQKYRIEMEVPDPGIAAGQFAVLYLGEECLGSGRIMDPSVPYLAEYKNRFEQSNSIRKRNL